MQFTKFPPVILLWLIIVENAAILNVMLDNKTESFAMFQKLWSFKKKNMKPHPQRNEREQQC